jgi:hypothetical protein
MNMLLVLQLTLACLAPLWNRRLLSGFPVAMTTTMTTGGNTKASTWPMVGRQALEATAQTVSYVGLASSRLPRTLILSRPGFVRMEATFFAMEGPPATVPTSSSLRLNAMVLGDDNLRLYYQLL